MKQTSTLYRHRASLHNNQLRSVLMHYGGDTALKIKRDLARKTATFYATFFTRLVVCETLTHTHTHTHNTALGGGGLKAIELTRR